MKGTAYVLLSGGQDSTTALFWARAQFDKAEAVSINYGQKHAIELECSIEIAHVAHVDRYQYDFPVLTALGDSALVAPGDVTLTGEYNNLPASFTPGRNDFFLSIIAAHAYKHQRAGDIHIVTGVCQTDFSGYPDCRQEYISAKSVSLSLAMDRKIYIHTPMMWLTKAETVHLARTMGEDCWEALSYSHTCYNGVKGGCEKCGACTIRAKGFLEAGFADPAKQRLATV